jgi:ActR/RegA family two-component response regulator
MNIKREAYEVGGGSAVPPQRRAVLIVEDDAATRLAMARLMEYRGFAVTAVGTVVEGLDAASVRRPDFVLLDLMLPDGHGSEVLDWVRANLPQARIAVITGCVDRSHVDRLAGRRVDVLLRKPTDFDAIADGLRLESAPA